MVHAAVSDGLLRVRISRGDVLLAFRRRLDVPLAAVREVRVADDVSPWLGWRGNELGLRLPGTLVPGSVAAGSYWWRERGWTFCCVHRGQSALVVDVEPGTGRWRRLVLGMDDPGDALARIEAARAAG